jgi:hypothetical protein
LFLSISLTTTQNTEFTAIKKQNSKSNMLSKMARVPQRNDEGALYRLLNNKFCIILSCGLLQNVLSCWLFYFVLRPNPNDPGVVYFVFGSLFKSSPVKHSISRVV